MLDTALLVIDIQNDYFPGGAMELEGADAAGAKAALAIKGFRVKNVVVAGMMTHMCVDASVRHAADLGYKVTLLGDACATRAQTYAGETVPARQVHAAFLAALNGFYAKVVNTHEL